MLAHRDALEDRFQTPMLTIFRRIPINVIIRMAAHHTIDRDSKHHPIVGVFVMHVVAGLVPAPKPRDPLVTD